jgi:hypothetical protein
VVDLRNFLFKDTKAAMKLKIIKFLKNVPAPLSSQFSNKVDRLTAIENCKKIQEITVQLYPICKYSCYNVCLLIVLYQVGVDHTFNRCYIFCMIVKLINK